MHPNRRATPNRRQFMEQTIATSIASSALAGATLSAQAADAEPAVTSIGTRRELFVESSLVERLEGGAAISLRHPQAREVALVHDAPWEGSGSGYHSVFHDGERYRMYYKAWHLIVGDGKVNTTSHPLFCCYAESDDGKVWRKPELGVHEFQGSKQNNIAIASGALGPLNVDAGHPAVFLDENPARVPKGRYKAIVRSSKPNGLIPFQSPDGIHWSPLSDAPILSGRGAFDSQNLAFWDPNIGQYRAYWRIFTAGVTTEKEWKPGGYRAIRTATSDDLLTWSDHVDLTYVDSPIEHLYTNQVKPYSRAPHLLIGFPTRYIERGWSDSMEALPELEHRRQRSAASQRYGTALTEALVMASRDGQRFQRWNEAFLRPGPERAGTWHYGQQYLAWHAVETRSNIPGGPNELSLYACEDYWTGDSSVLRRYALRLDGFAAAGANWSGGDVVTRPITFDGPRLHLNFATSAAGSLRVEIQSLDGKPLKNYSAEDCPDMFGDSVDRVVTWKEGADLSSLRGQPVRLRFVLKDADLYAYQFV